MPDAPILDGDGGGGIDGTINLLDQYDVSGVDQRPITGNFARVIMGLPVPAHKFPVMPPVISLLVPCYDFKPNVIFSSVYAR